MPASDFQLSAYELYSLSTIRRAVSFRVLLVHQRAFGSVLKGAPRIPLDSLDYETSNFIAGKF